MRKRWKVRMRAKKLRWEDLEVACSIYDHLSLRFLTQNHQDLKRLLRRFVHQSIRPLAAIPAKIARRR